MTTAAQVEPREPAEELSAFKAWDRLHIDVKDFMYWTERLDAFAHGLESFVSSAHCDNGESIPTPANLALDVAMLERMLDHVGQFVQITVDEFAKLRVALRVAEAAGVGE